MLSVDFTLDEPLKKELHDMKHDSKVRAVIAVIENERIVHHGQPIPATDSFVTDLTTVRTVVTDAKIEACFIVVLAGDGSFQQVMLVPEGVKPKVRMLYASSSAHLRNNCGLPIGNDMHVTALSDVTPALFVHDEDAKEMMTDKEKVEEEIAEMPVVPQATVMAGVAAPLQACALKAVAGLAAKDLKAAAFEVTPKGILCGATVPTSGSIADVIATVPEGKPRFVALHWNDKVLLVYVCPPNIKPKERMPYASSKASFVSQVGDNGIKFDRRLEIDEAATMVASIEEAMEELVAVEAKPTAPRASMPKGPRMLI